VLHPRAPRSANFAVAHLKLDAPPELIEAQQGLSDGDVEVAVAGQRAGSGGSSSLGQHGSRCSLLCSHCLLVHVAQTLRSARALVDGRDLREHGAEAGLAADGGSARCTGSRGCGCWCRGSGDRGRRGGGRGGATAAKGVDRCRRAMRVPDEACLEVLLDKGILQAQAMPQMNRCP